MLLRLQCWKEDKAFAPLVSFTFIVIAFPYKRTWKKGKKGYELRGSSDANEKKLRDINLGIFRTSTHCFSSSFGIVTSLKCLSSSPTHTENTCFRILHFTHENASSMNIMLRQGHRLVRRAQMRLPRHNTEFNRAIVSLHSVNISWRFFHLYNYFLRNRIITRKKKRKKATLHKKSLNTFCR